MTKDMRISTDLRRLARYLPTEKFTAKDLLDIANNQTNKIYERLASDMVQKEVAPPSGNITENKNKLIGKETEKRSFTVTPADGARWVDLLGKLRSSLDISSNVSSDEFRKILKALTKKNREKIGINKEDVRYILEQLK